MKGRFLRIGVGAVLLLTGYMAGIRTGTALHAEQRTAIPAQYGKLVAGDASSLWFEGSDGTLRQVNIPQGNTVFTISRER